MRLPPPTAAFPQRVRYGNYLSRRVRRARLITLAADAERATQAVLVAGRALEDVNKPIQDALADRDAYDDDLDESAQDLRANLAGRSADAMKSAPYTVIFHEGISYYTAAPLDEEVKRYTELKRRLEEHLPATDQARITANAAIDAGLEGFTAATSALATARTDDALASTRLTVATEAWEKQMEKTYGALVAEFGKTKAERFFPRIRGKKGDTTAPTGEGQ